MDYEKKYKEAFELMKDCIPDENGLVHVRPCEIFPELAESEDEKIRKVLVDYFTAYKEQKECGIKTFYGIPTDNIIAWLKKQGEKEKFIKKELDCIRGFHAEIIGDKVVIKKVEQKPTDGEPKFKVGNWYQCTKYFFGRGVTFNKNTAYYCAKEGCLKNEFGCHIAIVKDLYDNFKLWTIQDAKDGDVLVSESTCGINTWYCIFKSLDGDESMTVYCYLARDGRFETKKELCFDKDPYNTKPATKEQRDILFQKMHKAGFEWNADKKELKKINNTYCD